MGRQAGIAVVMTTLKYNTSYYTPLHNTTLNYTTLHSITQHHTTPERHRSEPEYLYCGEH